MKKSIAKENSRLISYKLLADCYYLPDQKLIKKIESLDKSIDGVCSEIAESAVHIDELDSLKVDFARLFVGPFKLLAAPYGSVYLEGSKTLMGDSTINAKKAYLREGLRIKLKEAPDHIAIELEFMYLLIFKEIEALKKLDLKSARDYREKQLAFLGMHLGRWVCEFTKNVEKGAQSEFYKNLARITRAFIENDLSNISGRANQGSL